MRGAVECWQPDVGCIAAGDRHIELAVRCWAAAMLSDYQISKRLRDFACPEQRSIDAPWAFALHCARSGVPAREVTVWLAELVKVPGWPDGEEIAYLVIAAIGGEGRP